jgi:putative transcriptional regulator
VLTICLAGLALLVAAQSVAAPGLKLSPEPWDTEPAAGMFLVAQRKLHSASFGRSVILILKHDATGTQGLIINQKSHWRLSEVVPDVEADEADRYPVFFGGPLGVHRVFMLIRKHDSSPRGWRIAGDIYFSHRRHVLESLLADNYPAGDLRLYIGYASWTAGQLALELARGSWHLVQGDAASVFDNAGRNLWERLIDTLEPEGIEVRLLPQPPAFSCRLYC